MEILSTFCIFFLMSDMDSLVQNKFVMGSLVQNNLSWVRLSKSKFACHSKEFACSIKKKGFACHIKGFACHNQEGFACHSKDVRLSQKLQYGSLVQKQVSGLTCPKQFCMGHLSKSKIVRSLSKSLLNGFACSDQACILKLNLWFLP